jgi:hypothetical protein
MDPGHTLRSKAAQVGEESLRGGMGSPEPPSLAQPVLASQPQGFGLPSPAFWAVWLQPWPLCGCIQASAAPGAQTPRAISAPELLIFLKRLAALTAMKFF